jgi:hypothetical protein
VQGKQKNITFRSYKKLAIFTTNVHAEYKTFGYHKCVSGALNRQFFVGAVRCWRSWLSVCKPLSLLSCRVIECRLCVAYFLFFLKRWQFFLIQFFFLVGFASSFKNFGLCGCLCGF